MSRRRLDAELVRRGLMLSRQEAHEAIVSGSVIVAGSAAANPEALVETAAAIHVQAPARTYVSRGGDKLDAALEGFGVDPSGSDALDVGASSGGFTDRLLRGGARHVVALDVGYGQLAWTLRQDPRVTVLERTNVRDLASVELPYAPDLVVADLSFISLRSALPAMVPIAGVVAAFVLLVKPQFEVPRAEVGRDGVVRDIASWRRSMAGVSASAAELGLDARGAMASPLRGPAGNVEFFLYLVAGGAGAAQLSEGQLNAAVAEGSRIR